MFYLSMLSVYINAFTDLVFSKTYISDNDLLDVLNQLEDQLLDFQKYVETQSDLEQVQEKKAIAVEVTV